LWQTDRALTRDSGIGEASKLLQGEFVPGMNAMTTKCLEESCSLFELTRHPKKVCFKIYVKMQHSLDEQVIIILEKENAALKLLNEVWNVMPKASSRTLNSGKQDEYLERLKNATN